MSNPRSGWNIQRAPRRNNGEVDNGGGGRNGNHIGTGGGGGDTSFSTHPNQQRTNNYQHQHPQGQQQRGSSYTSGAYYQQQRSAAPGGHGGSTGGGGGPQQIPRGGGGHRNNIHQGQHMQQATNAAGVDEFGRAAHHNQPPLQQPYGRGGSQGSGISATSAGASHAPAAVSSALRRADGKDGSPSKRVRWGANTAHVDKRSTLTAADERYVRDGQPAAHGSSNPHHMHTSGPPQNVPPHGQQRPTGQRAPPPPPPPQQRKKKAGFGNKTKCRYHGDHLWRDCPNNPRSKSFNGKDHRTMNFSTDLMATQQKQNVVVAAAAAASGGGGMGAQRGAALATSTPVAVGGAGKVPPKKPSPRSSAAAASKSSSILKQPPNILPSMKLTKPKSTSTSSSSNLFNTTNSARPIPRKQGGLAGASPSIPKKRKFLPSEDAGTGQQPGQGAGQAQEQHQAAGSSQLQQHQHIQQLQPNQEQQIQVTNVGGQWRRRAVPRAPSAGNNAIALSKINPNRRSRLMSKKGDSVYSKKKPAGGDGGGGEEESGSDVSPEKRSAPAGAAAGESVAGESSFWDMRGEKSASPEQRVPQTHSVERPARIARAAPASASAVAASTATASKKRDDGLHDTDSENEDDGVNRGMPEDNRKQPAKRDESQKKQNKTAPSKQQKQGIAKQTIKRKDSLGLEDSESSSSSSDSDSSDDDLPMAMFSKRKKVGKARKDSSSDDDLPMAMMRKKKTNDNARKKMSNGGKGKASAKAGKEAANKSLTIEKVSLQAEHIVERTEQMLAFQAEKGGRGTGGRANQTSLPDDSMKDDGKDGSKDVNDEDKGAEGIDNNKNQGNDNGEDDKGGDGEQNNDVPELDEETLRAEFEKDLFDLVEQTIRVNDQWTKRREGLWSGEKAQRQPEEKNQNGSELGGVDESDAAEDPAGLETSQPENEPFEQPDAAGEGGTNEQSMQLDDEDKDEQSLKENDVPSPKDGSSKPSSKDDLAALAERERLKNEQKRQKKLEKKKRKHSKGDTSQHLSKKQKKHGDHNGVEEEPWTQDEQRLFEEGMAKYPNNWGKIAAEFVTSRTPLQIRAHAQKLAKQKSQHPQPLQQQQLTAGANHNHEASDAASEISSGSDNDDVPAFLTCDKCGMVFAAAQEACEHENNCTITSNNNSNVQQQGRVFGDKNLLIQYLVDHHSEKDKWVNERDMIFFRPISPSSDEEHQLGNGGGDSRRDAAQSPPADLEDARANDGDGDDSSVEETSDTVEMNIVKHLCSTTVDRRTGLPVQKLTIMCADSETLYDFRVDIKQSAIPNAGHGAFLTYLGARVLKNKAAERSTRLMSKHVIESEVETHNPLTAVTLGGRSMSVKLTGDNLHYNDNSIYWTEKRSKEFIDFGSRHDSVESFDETEVHCDVHNEVEKLRKRIFPEGSGLGFLGIHSENDYVNDPKPFWSYPNGMFELGRYGPHRPQDRKSNLHFDFKNFILNYQPSEWSYEVPEQMLNRCQIVDITDDATGEVHSIAKEHTPIYVNEVGHNKKLRRNVFIRDKNERSVHYYVGIDEEHALRKGDTVELYVDYGEHYEQTRERKGYGKVNLSEKVGGDEDESSRLQRNFHEREEVEKDISSLKIYEMFHLVQFLTKQIYGPINEALLKSCPEEGTSNSDPQKYSLIARRRLHWLGEKLSSRFEEYIADPKVATNSEFIQATKQMLNSWKWEMLPSVFTRLKPDGRTTLLEELTEELLYQNRSYIPCPLDTTVWSGLAVDLMKKASVLLAQYLFCYGGPISIRKQYLADRLLKLARKSASAAREGSAAINRMKNNTSPLDEMENHINALSFKSHQRNIKKKNLLDESKERMHSLYNAKETVRFGTAATMADIQSYYDAVDLCGIETYYVPCKGKRVSECDRSIVSQYDGPSDVANTEEGKHSPQFRWMARSVDSFKKGDARVNEQWYIENQVLLAVHLLASSVNWQQPEGENDNVVYCLDMLCGEINLDIMDAKRALLQGAINPTWPKSEITPSYSPALTGDGPTKGSRRHHKARRRKQVQTAGKQIYNGPCEEYPGWTVRSIARASSSKHCDKYWRHPDLPEDIHVRSRVGVRTLIEYAETMNVSLREAYERNNGQTKFFTRRTS